MPTISMLSFLFILQKFYIINILLQLYQIYLVIEYTKDTINVSLLSVLSIRIYGESTAVRRNRIFSSQHYPGGHYCRMQEKCLQQDIMVQMSTTCSFLQLAMNCCSRAYLVLDSQVTHPSV